MKKSCCVTATAFLNKLSFLTDNNKKENFMLGFIFGLIIGAIFGVFLMCLMQVNRN